ncbi:MAG: carbohydrate ABC transporter substrate-binding protein [Treponema sp.]|nr:carbohydrate ABC transporter substrate-binding protein [Candidatus Treponema equifaecale]
MKKVIKVLAAVGLTMAVLSGCNEKSNPNELTVWSFTDELDGIIKNYYNPAHPEMNVKYSMTPTDQFPNKLDPVISSGNGCPDVFAMDAAFVRKYVESGLLLELDDIYEEIKDKMAEYPMKIGSHNGHVYAMSWQMAPGALFYRRSLAKKYLGTDDPAEVQKYVENLDKFIETAGVLKEASKGKCLMVSSAADLLMPYKGARKDPWVINDQLVIDPAMDAYMDMCKVLRDNGYEGRVAQWSEGWFAGMKDNLMDDKGNPVEVFCYFLPTWGLHYTLKPNSAGTPADNDWAMCAGPAPYFWGGTWLAAYKGTKNPAGAKEMIKFIASDDDYLEKHALQSGDLVGNMKVVNKIKDTYSEPFLQGQNHYAEFAEMAKTIDGSLIQGTDQQIEQIFNEAVAAYQNGEKTKVQAMIDFKKEVASAMNF